MAKAAGLLVEISEVFSCYSEPVKRRSGCISEPSENACKVPRTKICMHGMSCHSLSSTASIYLLYFSASAQHSRADCRSDPCLCLPFLLRIRQQVSYSLGLVQAPLVVAARYHEAKCFASWICADCSLFHRHLHASCSPSCNRMLSRHPWGARFSRDLMQPRTRIWIISTTQSAIPSMAFTPSMTLSPLDMRATVHTFSAFRYISR